VIDEEAVSGRGRVDDDGRDLAVLELEAQLASRVLVQGQSPFERPVEKTNETASQLMRKLMTIERFRVRSPAHATFFAKQETT
jgi:hypothetical protein